MIYKNMQVDIPEKVKILRRNGHQYVWHVVSSEYQKDKKYNIDNRVIIGKVSPDDETKLIPNANYFKYYSNPNIKYIESAGPFSDTVSIGAFLALNKIIQDLSLDSILLEIFPARAELMQSLVNYYIDANSTVHQQFEKWAFNNMIYTKHIYSESTISNLFNKEITVDLINDFLDVWNKKSRLTQDIDDIIISIDSTNMNVHSNDISIAEYGKPKDDEGLPQINISYAMDQITGRPLFYDLFPGSITDQVQFKQMCDKAKAYGYNNLTFVLDRGYFTQNNLEHICKSNYHYIIMAREYNNNLKKIRAEYRAKLSNDPQYYINPDVSGVKFKTQVFQELTKQYVYVYFSDSKAAAEKRMYNEKIERFKRNLQNVKKINNGILDTYSKYLTFNTDEKGNILSIEINRETQKRIYDNSGLFIIVSNLDMPLDSVLEMYRRRDIIEKMFRTLKSDLDYDKFYASSIFALESKVFMAFLTAIVRASFRYRIKPFLDNHSSECVNSALAHLNKIQITKVNNTYMRKYAFSAKQKQILSCLDIDENYINNLVIKYNQFLAKK
ncbi:MAG: IS1634 family transposase [Christensenellales bacterium]|jgi:transposase|nr:transposase [Clostridiales bacterium]